MKRKITRDNLSGYQINKEDLTFYNQVSHRFRSLLTELVRLRKFMQFRQNRKNVAFFVKKKVSQSIFKMSKNNDILHQA